MKAKRYLRRVGFTLTEILVVLAIATALALLLLAVMGRANERGRSAVCQSHLKQLALGMQQYVQDFGGHYPVQAGWQTVLLPYVKYTGLFRCSSSDPRNYSFPTGINYSYNFSRLMKVTNIKAEGRHESTLADASSLYLNTDQVLNDGYGTASGSCHNSVGVSLLHSGGSNFSFVDGHVKWLNPQQLAEMECSLGKADVHAP